MRNQITIYQVTTPKRGAVNLTLRNGTVKHSKEEKTIGWSLVNLITYCSINNYSIEKKLNVICLDGHENDDIVLAKTETKRQTKTKRQTGAEFMNEPPGITQLKEERKKKEAIKKRKSKS